MRSKESFNQAAELYDEVRPSYPNQVIDWIVKKTGVTTDNELLEIAPGTGQATKKFAERSFRIHAVELGNNLARILMENVKDKEVRVDISSFEDWIPPQNKKYKLIYCATAWHWIDPNIGYEKVSKLLEDNGYFALLWNNSTGSSNNEIMDKAYRLLFEYHNESFHSTKPKTKQELEKQKEKSKNELEQSGDFVLDNYFHFEWSILQPREKLIKGFYSQSSYLSLSDNEKAELNDKLSVIFKELPKEIDTYFRSTVYLCKKKRIV